MEDYQSLLYSWVPIVVMIAFWIFLARKGGFGKAQYMERNATFMERQEKLLERIAIALEERNKRER